eukprot:gene12533-biopygen11177
MKLGDTVSAWRRGGKVAAQLGGTVAAWRHGGKSDGKTWRHGGMAAKRRQGEPCLQGETAWRREGVCDAHHGNRSSHDDNDYKHAQMRSQALNIKCSIVTFCLRCLPACWLALLRLFTAPALLLLCCIVATSLPYGHGDSIYSSPSSERTKSWRPKQVENMHLFFPYAQGSIPGPPRVIPNL